MSLAPPRRSPPDVGGRKSPFLPGLATTGVLSVVIFLGTGWFHTHLSQGPRSPWGDPIFYVVQVVLAVLPGLLVGIILHRRNRLLRSMAAANDALENARNDLARTNRALTALSAVNHELIRATDQDVLLNRICQVMVDHSGYGLVWVALAGPETDKRVRVAARAGEDAPWLETLGIRYDDSAQGQGPTGTAIREGHCVVEPVFADAAFFQNWPSRPTSLDQYSSGASFPLRDGEAVIGALVIYERERREFGTEEITLLAQMADDVSYGLRFLRLLRAQGKAKKRLRQALLTSSSMAATAQELVGGSLSQAEMASLVLVRARKLTGSPFGAVGRINPRSGHLNWIAVNPEDHEANRRCESCELYADTNGRFAGPLAGTLNDGKPLLRNAPLSLAGISPFSDVSQWADCMLAVALRNPDGSTAGLILLTNAPAGYSKADVRAVRRLAVLLDMARARSQAEENLIIARRQAEAANEAKTQFLSNVSHELRTPINGILGMAQLAILEGVDARAAEYWQTVRESTDRLVALVDNLIELANVESGSLSPQLREFSLRRMVDSLRNAFSVRAGLAGLSLTIEIETDLPDKLLGDPFRLRQILSNLLANAIRFTPTGGITVKVSRYSHGNAGGTRRVFVANDFSGICLLFAVADTGVGVPPGKQEAIFDSFTLGEDCLTKRFGGSGMGLSIARRLAELLGGSIWVESQVGFGSTFYLTAPLWPAAPGAASPTPASEPQYLPSLKILVVEDEAVNRLALARGLRKLGHEVVEADNGDEALRQLSSQRVDVVIMDVQMPVMDGLTAVSHIRNGEVPGTNRRLPVVALTAYALEGDRKRFLDAGMDEFVTKPCDMSQLLAAVSRAMGLRQAV